MKRYAEVLGRCCVVASCYFISVCVKRKWQKLRKRRTCNTAACELLEQESSHPNGRASPLRARLAFGELQPGRSLGRPQVHGAKPTEVPEGAFGSSRYLWVEGRCSSVSPFHLAERTEFPLLFPRRPLLFCLGKCQLFIFLTHVLLGCRNGKRHFGYRKVLCCPSGYKTRSLHSGHGLADKQLNHVIFGFCSWFYSVYSQVACTLMSLL